jgi:hypothetical protein
MTLDRTTTLWRAQDVLTAEIDDELAMMSMQSGTYVNLDAIGKRIWTLLETPITVAALCQQLVQEFDVPLETCEQDVLAFLEELHTQQVIQQFDVA